MKTVLAMLVGLAGCLPAALGQGLSIQLVLEQERLAQRDADRQSQGDKLLGQTLQLGTGPDWLTVQVEDSHHLPLARQGTVPVAGEFSLEPSMTATKKLDLAPYFNLTQPGRYSVSATLNLPQWRQSVQSKPVFFDIIAGSSVWEQEFGLPNSAGADGQPEIRHYALVRTVHSKVPKLYFRLTDARGNEILRTFSLGPVVSFSTPEPEIDRFSNLHVLHQSGSRDFVHCLINPDGILLARETYEISATRPVLHGEKDGRITVVGGTRRVDASDLPPPSRSTSASNANLGQP